MDGSSRGDFRIGGYDAYEQRLAPKVEQLQGSPGFLAGVKAKVLSPEGIRQFEEREAEVEAQLPRANERMKQRMLKGQTVQGAIERFREGDTYALEGTPEYARAQRTQLRNQFARASEEQRKEILGDAEKANKEFEKIYGRQPQDELELFEWMTGGTAVRPEFATEKTDANDIAKYNGYSANEINAGMGDDKAREAYMRDTFIPQLDSAAKRTEALLNERDSVVTERYWKDYEKNAGTPGLYPELNMWGEGRAFDDEWGLLKAADELNKETQQFVDAATERRGFWRGMGRKLADLDTWIPAESLLEYMGMEDLKDVDPDKATPAQQALMEALALRAAAEEQYKVRNVYKAGETVAEMVPLALEMAINPLGSVGKAAGKAAAKKVTKKAIKEAAEEAGKAAAKKTLKKWRNKFLIGAAHFGGSLAGGAGMAATSSAPKVAINAGINSIGQAKYDIGYNGLEFSGFKPGGSYLEELGKEYARTTIAHGTEQMGAEWLNKLVGKPLGGAAKVLKKIPGVEKGVAKGTQLFNDFVGPKKKALLEGLAKTVNYNGPIEEFGEEFTDAVLNAPLDYFDPQKENYGTLKEFFKEDNLETLVVSVVAPSLLGFGAAATVNVLQGGYKAGAYEKLKQESAFQRAEKAFAGNHEEWRNISYNLNNPENFVEEMRRVYNGDYTPEQKKTALEYAVHTLKYMAATGSQIDLDENTQMLNGMLRESYGWAYDNTAPEAVNGNVVVAADKALRDAESAVKTALGVPSDTSIEDFVGNRSVDEVAMGDDAVAEALRAYYAEKALFEGMQDKMQDTRESEYMEADKSVDAVAHEDGNVYRTTLPETGETIFITGGKVVLDNEGYIDVNQSEGLVALMPNSKKEAIQAGNIRNKVIVENAQAQKAAKRAEIDARYKQQLNTFTYTDKADGTEHTVQLVSRGEQMARVILDGVEQDVPNNVFDEIVAEATGENGKVKNEKGNVSPVEATEQPELSNAEQLPKEKQAPAPIPVEKRGKEERAAYHMVPIERTMEDLHDGTLEPDEIVGLIDARIKEAENDVKNVEKKKPVIGADKNAYVAAKQQWQADMEAAKAKLDYYNQLKAINAEVTRSEMREAVEAVEPQVFIEQTPDEFVANQLGGFIKITPESFQKETGLKTEQKQMVGVIAGKDKGGVSIERAAEIILENYGDELRGLGFNGDMQDMRDMIINILSNGNPRSYAKKGAEMRAQESVDGQMSQLESIAIGMGFKDTDEMIAYEEAVVPRIIQDYTGFDETEYFNNLAENIEYDTTRESEGTRRGSELLQGEQSADNAGTGNIAESGQGGEVQSDVYSGGENAAPQGNQQVSSSEFPNNQNRDNVSPVEGAAEGGNAPGQSGVAEIKEPTFTEEVLKNGDKRITNYNSRGEVETVATERNGKVVSVDNYDEGVLFETTTYDENGVATSVTRYDKSGNVVAKQEFEKNGKPANVNTHSVIKSENEKKALRKRAEKWAKKLGVKVHVLESYDEVTDEQAKEQILEGRTPGWFSNGEVYIYMPHLVDEVDLDRTVVHESVAHKGIKQMLGEEFNKFLDNVWNAMSVPAKAKFLSYVGAGKNATQADRRAAADEYVAALAEKVYKKQGLTAEEKTIWQKFADWFRKKFNVDKAKAEVLSKETLTDEDIAKMIRASYETLKVESGSVKGESGGDFRARKDNEVASVDGDRAMFRLASSNASAIKYDKMNGTNVKEFFDFLRGGMVFEKGKPNVFHIANAGNLLEQYGIKGKFMVGQFTFSRTHTQNEDHNLGIKEWVDVINNLNNPLAITSYKGLPNEYRIYTYATVNGKNICVGVNVSLKEGEIELSNIISAYGRDINNLLGKEGVNLLYPDMNELKRRISQVSTAHNSLLNATSTASADKDNTGSAKKQGNGTKFRKDDATLIGTHSLTEEKLRKAIKMGGLANPSTAIFEMGEEMPGEYGEITFVMPSSMVDKKTGRNTGAFAGDAWTPTYPQVERQMGKRGSARAREDVQSVPKEMQKEVRMGLDSWLDGREGAGLAYLFLQEEGMAPELSRVAQKYPDEIRNRVSEIAQGEPFYRLSPEQKQQIVDLFVEQHFNGDMAYYSGYMKEKVAMLQDKIADENTKSFIKKSIQQYIDGVNEYGYEYEAVSDFLNKVQRDINHSGAVNDMATTQEAARIIREQGLEKEFQEWKEELVDRYEIKEVIFKGFTPTGNRKYVPHTLENVSMDMKEQGRNGAVGLNASFNKFAAGLLKPLGSLDAIRKRKGNLRPTHADTEAFKNKWSEVYYDLAEKLQPDAKGYEDYGLDRVAEAATKKDPKAFINSEYGIELSEADEKALKDMIWAIQNEYPVMYFETKFERPVYLDEFAGVALPENVGEDIVEALNNAGVKIETYEPGNEKARMDAVKRLSEGEGIRFRKGSMRKHAAEWADGMQKQEPKQWAKIVEAMKLSPVWNMVEGDDNSRAAEVLQRLSDSRVNDLAQKEIDKARGVIEKAEAVSRWYRIKNAISDFWNWVQRNVFGTEPKNWEDFVDEVIGDYEGKTKAQRVKQKVGNLTRDILNAVFDKAGIDIELAEPVNVEQVAVGETESGEVEAENGSIPSVGTEENASQAASEPQARNRNMDREAWKKAFKKGGEKAYDLMYELHGGIVSTFPDEFLNYLKEVIGVPSDVANIVEAAHDYLLDDFKKKNPELFKRNESEKVEDVHSLLATKGYSLLEHTMDNGKAIGVKMMYRDKFVPSGKTDAGYTPGTEWHGMTVICYYNHPEMRLQNQYVFTVTKNNAMETPTAYELVADPSLMTAEWAEYLEKEGRKNEDGTYNLDGLVPNFNDPFSLSHLMIRVNKNSHDIETISRYNHGAFNERGEYERIAGQPNATLGNNLDKLVEGLSESLMEYKQLVTLGAVPLGENMVKANDGKVYRYNTIKGGMFIGDGFWVDQRNDAHAINPGKEKLVGEFLYGGGKILNVTNGESVDVHGLKFTENGVEFYTGGEEVTETREIEIKGERKTVAKKVIKGDAKNVITFDGDRTSLETESADAETFGRVGKVYDVYSIKGDNLIDAGRGFLDDFFSLRRIDFPNLEKAGDNCFNVTLTSANLPKLREVGVNCFNRVSGVNVPPLPSLEKVGANFMYSVGMMGEDVNIDFPKLREVGISFMRNAQPSVVSLPSLETCGEGFMKGSMRGVNVDLPNLTKAGREFFGGGFSVLSLNAPKLTDVQNDFMEGNQEIRQQIMEQADQRQEHLEEQQESVMEGQTMFRRGDWNERVDRDGNPIGDGSWHMNYKVDEVALSYPNISYKVDESASTESVYVTYTNNDPKYPENGRPKVTVRYSIHDSNAVKFGDQLRGEAVERNNGELLYRLGLKEREWIPAPSVPTRTVSKKDLKNNTYEESGLTERDIMLLPVGADIAEHKGKLIKGTNELILVDKVLANNNRGYYRYSDIPEVEQQRAKQLVREIVEPYAREKREEQETKTMFRKMNKHAEEFNKTHKGGVPVVEIDPNNMEAELIEEELTVEDIQHVKGRKENGVAAIYNSDKNIIYLLDPSLDKEAVYFICWHEDTHVAITAVALEPEMQEEFYSFARGKKKEDFENLLRKHGYEEEDFPEESLAYAVQAMAMLDNWSAELLSKLYGSTVEGAQRQMEIIQPLIDYINNGRQGTQGSVGEVVRDRGMYNNTANQKKTAEAEGTGASETATGGLTEEVNSQEGETLFRRAEQMGEDEVVLTGNAVAALGERVNVPVRVVDDVESLPEKRKNKKGWFEDGEVVVVLPNHVSMEDAMQTVLHEVVGRKGLRAVMGEEFDALLDVVYRNLPKGVKSRINYVVMTRFVTPRQATEEYIAGLAGKNSQDAVLNDIMQRMGDYFRGAMNLEVEDGELRYMLWKNNQRLQTPDVLSMLQDFVMETETNTGDNGTRFRIVNDTAKDAYEKNVRGTWNKVKEGHYDRLRSVRKAQEVIADETGMPISDSEDVYSYAEHLPSINKIMKEQFDNKFLTPFIKLLKRIYDVEFNGKKLDEKSVERYTNAKHGLERNRDMAVANALTTVEEVDGKKKPVFNKDAYEDWQTKKAAILAENITWEEKQDKLDALAKTYGAKLKDYSGLTAIFDPEGKMKYKQLRDEAIKYVTEMEGAVGKKSIDELWKIVKGMTDFSLKQSYESGLLSKDMYESISKRYEFYVPLRGFTEETAEDYYDYLAADHTPLNSVIKRAEGRKSEADNIFATILNMANSAIVFGNKNRLKQRVLNLATRHKSSLLSVDRAWYEKKGEDVWELALPVTNENMTEEQLAQVYADFEADMKRKEALGEARRQVEGLNIKTRVISDQNKAQHAIRVKRNGREYIVWVNASPTMANAVNGMLREEETGWVLDKIDAINKFRSKMVTQFSPTFVLTNLFRDVQGASTVYGVRYGAKALGQFEMNVMGNSVKMMGLYAKFKKGTLDESVPLERYFKEFLENGGETGYTEMISIEEYNKALNELTEKLNIKNATGRALEAAGEGVEFANRCVENLCRFSAYMTSRENGMSILQSVNDAKEVSVNFNRKGSGAKGAGMAKRLFMFYNPAVQALVQRYLLAKNYPKRMIPVLAGEFALGAMQPILFATISALASSAFGDDDDETWEEKFNRAMGRYYNLTDYRRRGSVCLPLGDGVFNPPLAHESRVFFGLGELAMSWYNGHETYDNIPAQAMDIIGQSLPLNLCARLPHLRIVASPCEWWLKHRPAVGPQYICLLERMEQPAPWPWGIDVFRSHIYAYMRGSHK